VIEQFLYCFVSFVDLCQNVMIMMTFKQPWIAFSYELCWNAKWIILAF